MRIPVFQLKFSMFEGAVRGAACIYSPLIDRPSRVSTQLFHIADWLPTLYSAAGGNSNDLEEPPIDGIDQWPAIKSAKAGGRRSALLNIEEASKSEAALMGRYKIIKGPLPHFRLRCVTSL
jgi:arylsulfatase A-like enzyme